MSSMYLNIMANAILRLVQSTLPLSIRSELKIRINGLREHSVQF